MSRRSWACYRSRLLARSCPRALVKGLEDDRFRRRLIAVASVRDRPFDELRSLSLARNLWMEVNRWLEMSPAKLGL
jgi:hypothetical protein